MSRRLALALSVALLTGFSQAQTPREITFEEIARPKPGEWPSYNGLLSANRHSPLDQINTRNVASLEPVWTHEMGGERALQMTPLVVDGVMYVAAVNEVRALDARNGRQIWQFARPQTPGLVPTGDPASGINRAIAVLGNRVFLQTDHAHLLAVDRRTGALLWDVEMADARQNYGATGALLIVNDLVIAGISAGDEGVRGFLDAYRASTGERVWRFWTVPARGEPGSETWIGKALEHGCATTWLTGSYDPAANLLYWPTGNPCPDYNGDERKGDNLYSSSVIALDPATGQLRWHFQFTPHDMHDWDANQPPMLIDANFRGAPRKLLAVANRNGFFYVLDRLTGAMLMAEPFVKNLTWASGIGADGRPKLLPGYENDADGTADMSRCIGRRQLALLCVQPGNGLVLRHGLGSVRGVSKEYGLVRAWKVVLRRNDKARDDRRRRKISTGARPPIGKADVGSAKGRRRRDGIGSHEHRGWSCRLWRQHGGSADRGRRKNRTAPVAVRDSANVEIEPDDVRDRRDAVHRRRLGVDSESFRIASEVDPELSQAATDDVFVFRHLAPRFYFG